MFRERGVAVRRIDMPTKVQNYNMITWMYTSEEVGVYSGTYFGSTHNMTQSQSCANGSLFVDFIHQDR